MQDLVPGLRTESDTLWGGNLREYWSRGGGTATIVGGYQNGDRVTTSNVLLGDRFFDEDYRMENGLTDQGIALHEFFHKVFNLGDLDLARELELDFTDGDRVSASAAIQSFIEGKCEKK